ncbi:MAG: glycosyltransferase [Sedimentisphaerales bacterium]|nr:glycosyltransferase [Sedimentisphaerales bacterium]
MTNREPLISVVVASKDRPAGIRRLLVSLASQDWPAGRLEILIVDDGSQPAYRLDDPAVRLIRHDVCRGAQRSRNDGLAASTGELVLLCDDDVELLDRDFLRRCRMVLCRRPQVAAVFGRKIDVFSRDRRQREREFSTARPTLYSGDLVPCRRPAGAVAWAGQVFLARRDLLLEIGGYDGIYGLNGGHSFREESDLHARLRRRGYQLWFLPEIAFRHHIVPDGGHGPAVGSRLYWIAHNHIIFLRRHLPCWPLRAAGFLLDVVRYSWVQGRFRHTFSMLRGYAAGWRNALRDRGPNRNTWLEKP